MFSRGEGVETWSLPLNEKFQLPPNSQVGEALETTCELAFFFFPDEFLIIF